MVWPTNWGNSLLTFAEVTQPLRELLSTKTAWVWMDPFPGAGVREAQGAIDPADCPGAVQPTGSSQSVCRRVVQWIGRSSLPAVRLYLETCLICFTSYRREAMTETEKRWACDRFSSYLLGRSFTIESGQKPFMPLLSIWTTFLQEYCDTD